LRLNSLVGKPPTLFDFHGVWMTCRYTGNWDALQTFQARPDDILIATYPKAGTTWVSYILDLLYFGHLSPERQKTVPITERVPFLEVTNLTTASGTELAEKLLTTPRLIKTHLPVQFVPKSFWEHNCRMIYVARNAKDNMVSYFHFARMTDLLPEPGDWTCYFQSFLAGKVPFGSWFDHVNGWWRKRRTYPKLHFMFYEDLSEVTKTEVMSGVKFDSMRNNAMTNYSTYPLMKFDVSPFMRKGQVGDWKSHFTVAQDEEFDEDYKKKIDPTLHLRTEI
uniref:Sulfotransferase n=1 Tax=Salarias fasciatus TaxID=181472 RepID=A0A672G3Q1_SALFA